MLFKLPKYYKEFKCKADKCTDSCCIGWEIDIDGQTAEKYLKIKGELGGLLRENTEEKDGVLSFRLLEGDRCPFLESDGLCRLIKTGGEELLCEICREHPRFYTNLGVFGVGGFGAACEEAARLVLNREMGEGYETVELDAEGFECEDPEFAQGLWRLEDIIYEGLFAKGNSLAWLSRLAEAEQSELCKEAETIIKRTEIEPLILGNLLSALKDKYSKIEPLSESFLEDILSALSLAEESSVSFCAYLGEGFDAYAARLCAYFLHRYLFEAYFDREIAARLRFVCEAVTVIGALCFAGKAAEIAVKDFSKNIEYNPDNVTLLT